MTYQKLGEQLGALTDRKNAAYGSSFARAGDYLRLLYPLGLRPEQYGDALLLARDFDKAMRIATDQDAFGESPWDDKAGYALLGAQMHRERKQRECGSASAKDVDTKSMEPNGSAEINAPETTTTSANAKSATPSEPPSPKPHAHTLRSLDVRAAASRLVADGDGRLSRLLGEALLRNEDNRCGYAHATGPEHRVYEHGLGDGDHQCCLIFPNASVLFCCESCRDMFTAQVYAL